MANAELFILISVVCINSFIVSAFIQFALVQNKMPEAFSTFKPRSMLLSFYIIYLILVALVAVLFLFILYRSEYIGYEGIKKSATYLVVINLITLCIFTYAYVRNVNELTEIRINDVTNMYDQGVPSADSCKAANKRQDKKDQGYSGYDMIYNHNIFLVNSTIVTSLFFMSFLFQETFKIL